MRVSDVGEFGLISLLATELGLDYPPSPEQRPRPGLLVDIGDDAAVSESRDRPLIWTTDTLVAGVHFLTGLASWESIGWKALAVNVSDVAAMGGRPDMALVTLGVPGDFEVEDARALYRGLREAADEYGVKIVGGDVVRCPVFWTTVAVCGLAGVDEGGEPRLMTRSGAKAGDIVAVTGAPGDSAGGLDLLRSERQPRSAVEERLVQTHLRPRPRVGAGIAAAAAGVRCAIDISDGLLQDLGHVVRASGVGIRIEAARVPVSMDLQEVFGARALGFALAGGEDYELALIAPSGVMEALLDRDDLNLTAIGEVVASDELRVVVVDESGREMDVGGKAGWDHFARGGGPA